jgi:hypothetical protein
MGGGEAALLLIWKWIDILCFGGWAEYGAHNAQLFFLLFGVLSERNVRDFASGSRLEHMYDGVYEGGREKGKR